MILRGTLTAVVLALGLYGVGCGDRNTTAPQPPSGPSAAPAAPNTTPAAASPAADAGPIPWAVPADWERIPGERPMRVATFRRASAPDEEIVVSQFPGDVGGVLANVNRWRAQVGLGPITEDQLKTEIAAFDNQKLKGYTMRLRGEAKHMVAAIISDPAANRTWFVKAVCTPASADTLEPSLIAFAKSFGTGSTK